MAKRNYVGVKVQTGKGITYERFLAPQDPTHESHGDKYNLVMGPFRTKLGALCHVHYGHGNPHTTTVSDCERIAPQYADDLRSRGDTHFVPSAN